MNYSELAKSVAEYLDRTDLANQIPTFVRIAESRMNRKIRTRMMEFRVVADISRQFSTLPDDFLEMRNIQFNTDPVEAIQYVTAQEADRLRQSGIQGRPRFFTVVANRLEFIPAPAQSYQAEMVYYRAIPTITGENTTNWLIRTHFDCYLYGTLVQAALYLKDDPNSWQALFDQALQEIRVEDERSQYQGTTPRVRGTRIG